MKLTWFKMGDVELNEMKYLHPSATAFAYTTFDTTIITASTTANSTRAKVATVSCTATTLAAAINNKSNKGKTGMY